MLTTTHKTLDTFIKDYNNNNLVLSLDTTVYGASVASSLASQFSVKSSCDTQLRLSGLGKHAMPQALNYVLSNYYNYRFSPVPRVGYSNDIFHCGDVTESKLIALWEAYGLEVSDKQKEVTWNGVLGHIDCVVNEHTLVDVKSANDSNFKRYLKNPPISYLTQVATYQEATGCHQACLLFYNKNTSRLGAYYLTDDDRQAVLPRAKEIIDTTKRCKTIEDVYDCFEVPELVVEVFQKTATGNYVCPYDLYDPYPDLLYEREQGVSGYGDERMYVTAVRTPEQVLKLLKL